MKICFETFGCRLNRAEALDDEAKCLARGHAIVASHAEADLIVVRGCSVTHRAQRDCEKLVAHLREKYPRARVCVTGCLPGAKKFVLGGGADAKGPEASSAAVPTRTARAYLKVQDGCNGRCTFCIVPQFRGASVSVPFGEVLDRARRFVEAGYHELVVTGCNLALYLSEGRRLADLAAELARIDADCRVRIGSVEPGPAATDLVRAMAETPGICRFLHAPVQSGSDVVLARMRRPYRIRDAEELFELAHRLMPDMGLGCDMMSGFPGETDVDHMASVAFLRRHGVANVHAFPYSERPSTPASLYEDRVAREVRTARAHALAKVGGRNLRLFARTFVGRTVRAVVETHRGAVAGWTGEYLWLEARTLTEAQKRLHLRKRLMAFRVTEAHDGRLVGEFA